MTDHIQQLIDHEREVHAAKLRSEAESQKLKELLKRPFRDTYNNTLRALRERGVRVYGKHGAGNGTSDLVGGTYWEISEYSDITIIDLNYRDKAFFEVLAPVGQPPYATITLHKGGEKGPVIPYFSPGNLAAALVALIISYEVR